MSAHSSSAPSSFGRQGVIVLNKTNLIKGPDLVLSYFNSSAQSSLGLDGSSVGDNVRNALPVLFTEEKQYDALKISYETSTLYRDRKLIESGGVKSSLEILGLKDRDDYILFVGRASQNEVVSMSAHRSTSHIESILALASDGFMDWVVGAPIVRLTERWMRRLGRQPVPFVTIGDFEALTSPEDRHKLWSSFGVLIRGHQELIEFRPRLLAQDNSYVPAKVVATIIGSADGVEPMRIIACFSDP